MSRASSSASSASASAFASPASCAPLAALAAIAAERALPCAFVDLAAFDRNCAAVARLASGKRVRIASKSLPRLRRRKSLRVPSLIERVLARGPPFLGVMAYDARECERLVERGIDDVLVAYPCMDADALAALRRAHESGARAVAAGAAPVARLLTSGVSLVVDGPDNVDALARGAAILRCHRDGHVAAALGRSRAPRGAAQPGALARGRA